MHEPNISEAALELILAKDPRFARDAYSFVREALDHTQKTIGKDKRHHRHVSGQELLEGIRDFALSQFGPMTTLVLEEWGIRTCQDFGDIVFNMIELGREPLFNQGDVVDPPAFLKHLSQEAEALSKVLWGRFPDKVRKELSVATSGEAIETGLVRELNRILRQGPLYAPEIFETVALSEESRSQVGRRLEGIELTRFNRALIEDAYPGEIMKSMGLLAKTETDTRADFAHGYDFHETFRKPFLPRSKQNAPAPDRRTIQA